MLFCAEVFKMFFTKVGLFGLIICVHYPLNSQDKGPTAGADCTHREGTFYWLAGCSCHCFSLFFFPFLFPFFFFASSICLSWWTLSNWPGFRKKNHVHLNEVFPWGVQHRRNTCAAWPCISIGQRTEAKTEIGGEMTHSLKWKQEHDADKGGWRKRWPETCKKGRQQVLWEFK